MGISFLTLMVALGLAIAFTPTTLLRVLNSMFVRLGSRKVFSESDLTSWQRFSYGLSGCLIVLVSLYFAFVTRGTSGIVAPMASSQKVPLTNKVMAYAGLLFFCFMLLKPNAVIKMWRGYLEEEYLRQPHVPWMIRAIGLVGSGTVFHAILTYWKT